MHPEEEPLLRQAWTPNSCGSLHLLRSSSNHALEALGTLISKVVIAFRLVTAPSRSPLGGTRKALGIVIAVAAIVIEVIFQSKGIPYLTTNFPKWVAITVALMFPMMLRQVGDLGWVLPRCEIDTHIHLVFFRTGVDDGISDATRKNSFTTFLDELTRGIPVICYSLYQVGQIILGPIRGILFPGLMIFLNVGFRKAWRQTEGVVDNWRWEVKRNKAFHDPDLEAQDFERIQENLNRSSRARAVTDISRKFVWATLFLSGWIGLFMTVGTPDVSELSEAIFIKVFKDAWSLDDRLEKLLKAYVLAKEILKGYGILNWGQPR